MKVYRCRTGANVYVSCDGVEKVGAIPLPSKNMKKSSFLEYVQDKRPTDAEFVEKVDEPCPVAFFYKRRR